MKTVSRKLRIRAISLVSSLLVAAFLLISCDFGVTNPGKIRVEDLNSKEGMQAIVTGMSADLSNVYDDISFTSARLSDELAASGSYFISTKLRFGTVDPDDVNFYWEGIQQARYVAEDGLSRMQEVLGEDFDGNELTVRAYLFAGFSNRAIAENWNRDVLDGGSPQPASATFERAVGHFENAVQQAQMAENEDYLYAAYGGLAQAYVGLGQWDLAVENAEKVPTGFVHSTVYSSNSSRESNEYRLETHDRYEASAFGTLAAAQDPQDPRAIFTDCEQTPENCSATVSADGVTTMYRQEKFPELGSDIPLIKGTEMRLIEAEAALQDNDLGTAMDKINEVREYHGLDPLSASGIGELGGQNRDDGWDILDRERHLTLWLEGRRLHDLRRWDHYFLDGGSVVYEGVTRRASYLPISESECSANASVTCEKPYTE